MTPNDSDAVRGRVIVAAILGATILASAALVSHAAVEAFQIHHAEKRITVTGSTTKRIRSDFVVWKATVKSRGPEMAEAYKKLASDVPAVVAFMKAHGVADSQIKVDAASIVEVHPRDKEGHEIPDVVSAYVTEETVQVSSGDIEKVEAISRQVTELINHGIYITSEPPRYMYTKLSELKVQMLADASKDARDRADQIAAHAGSRVRSLIVARMGVMQVNPAYSTDVSSEGNNDKTSLEKDAMAIVTASFAVD